MNNFLKLQNQIKEALKNQDHLRLSVLKMLLSKAKNKQIELRGLGKEFTDNDFDLVVLSDIKSHKESIEAFRVGNREDLYKKEEAELAILQEFAPQQLSDKEVREKILAIVEKIKIQGEVNFGLVMGKVMAELKGKADGDKVNKVVREILE